jgi:hypothetical protein
MERQNGGSQKRCLGRAAQQNGEQGGRESQGLLEEIEVRTAIIKAKYNYQALILAIMALLRSPVEGAPKKQPL